MALHEGLLFASDSRTNAGVDHVSTFSKMTIFEASGERVIVLLNSGNLATTQTVVSRLRQALATDGPNLLNVPSLFDCATLVGEGVRQVISHHSGQQAQRGSVDFSCNFLVGGQIAGERPRLFLVYPEGNFIEASDDTPYFQIGETKYGRPILIRGYDRSMSFEDAVKLMMVSFDSTLKANLSVGLPLDLLVIEKDAFAASHEHRVTAEDPYYATISSGWGDALRSAFHSLPPYFFSSKD
jgi:putative proteasome-type protease